MTSALRNQILNQKDIKSVPVEIPEWVDEQGKAITVMVKALSALDRSLVLETSVDEWGKTSLTKLYPQVLVKCTFDPVTGEQVFEEADVDAVMQRNPVATDRIFSKALELSGMQQGALDNARKNSPSTQSESSTSN
jgi:hypothetical protein